MKNSSKLGCSKSRELGQNLLWVGELEVGAANRVWNGGRLRKALRSRIFEKSGRALGLVEIATASTSTRVEPRDTSPFSFD